MKFRIVISGAFLVLGTLLSAQSMVGLPKEEVAAIVKSDHRQFRIDNTVVKQRFNYLKYVNGIKTQTWILYFDDNDICKTSKLVCDYSEFNEIVEKLSETYEKVGESEWQFVQDGKTVEVDLIKQEWYFTIRETWKSQEKQK